MTVRELLGKLQSLPEELKDKQVYIGHTTLTTLCGCGDYEFINDCVSDIFTGEDPCTGRPNPGAVYIGQCPLGNLEYQFIKESSNERSRA